MVLEGSARAVKAGLVPVFVIQSRKKQGKKKIINSFVNIANILHSRSIAHTSIKAWFELKN